MITYYCPNCWKILDQNQATCPDCGFVLEEFSQLSYEGKLLSSLYHTVPERRIIATQILGDLKSQAALKEFKNIVYSIEMDYYFLCAILQATAKIDHPDRLNILKKATRNSSILVSSLAKEFLIGFSKKP